MLSPSRRGLKHIEITWTLAACVSLYNAVPIAKGTETSTTKVCVLFAAACLQCCPHREGD